MTAAFDIQDLPQERPRRTRRRPPSEIGAVVLVVLVLVVAVLAGSRPRIVPGSADPSPSALLPPAGGCLHWEVDPDAQSVPVSSTVVSVDCSQLHEGQVVQAWRSGRLPPSSTIQQICRAPRSSTVSVGDDWSFALAGLQAGVVSTGSGPLDFLACVDSRFGPGVARPTLSWSGTLSDEEAAADPSLRWCLLADGRTVGCRQAHSVERLGFQLRDESTGGFSATTCADFAQRRVGSAAPFAAGLLVARTEKMTTDDLVGTGSPFIQGVFCDVLTPSGRTLVDSVVGLGEAALPWG